MAKPKTKNIKVNLGERSYSILVGRNLGGALAKLLKERFGPKKILVVTDKRIAALHSRSLLKTIRNAGAEGALHIVPSGERAKQERELFRIYGALLSYGCDRSSAVIALGGGTIGDLAGFAAATYMRGIAFINCPTTLLAQVDSSIGGKTGIDLPQGKNLIGAFYQPRLVCCDESYLETLPTRELVSGLSEVIKYGVLGDKRLFEYLEKNIEGVLDCDRNVLNHVVTRCARIKADMVARDEYEQKGVRARLNLGHTFAHGFEGAAGYSGINHAQAVALGLIAAGRLSVQKGFFTTSSHERLVSLVKRAKLPIHLRKFSLTPQRIIRFMKRDKKARGGRLKFILPTSIGKVRIYDRVKEADIKRALAHVR